jgi:hypothetical protein
VATTFQIRFTGGDVHPVTVPAHELADLLLGAEQAISSLASKEFPELDASTLVIGLSSIKDASLGLEFTTNRPDVVGPAFQRLANGIHSKTWEDFPSRSLAGLEIIANFTSRRKCAAQFWNGVGSTEPLAVLDENFCESIPRRSRVRGETLVYGRVERVGGVEPKARLRLLNGDSLSCRLSEGLARQLGGKLYEEVALRGTATWDASDYSLIYFYADELTNYEPIGLTEAFQELKAVAGRYYSDIEDVVSYVRDFRYGEA